MEALRCTISGSFRRFLPQVGEVMRECAEQGVRIISPRSNEVVGEREGFLLLKGDTEKPQEIELRHLRSIRSSDFLYVVNPGGYVGPSATMEIGYALAISVPVFCLEAPTESVLTMFVRSGASVADIKRELKSSAGVEIPRRADLSVLQAYIRKVVRLRGFDDESLRDVVLLLVEEVGELAKAVRRHIGLKVDLGNDRKMIAHEVADCFIYLLDIANLAEIDLDDAFRAKEEMNTKKQWASERQPE